MVDQHHAKQRRKHRTDQQQKVLVLRQRCKARDQGAQHPNSQGQVFDLELDQQAGRYRCRVNIGKGVFRLVQQYQQQRNAQPGARQCQQQGVGVTARGERQRVGDAQAHEPEVANEKAQGGTAEHALGTTAKTRIVGNQRQPGQRHGDGDIKAHAQGQAAIPGLSPECAQVGLGKQVPGQP